MSGEMSKWSEEPSKEPKPPGREKEQGSAMTPAKPESNDGSSQIQACSSAPVPSPLLPPPSRTLEWSETVQVNNCEEVERQVGKVEEYLSKPYFILQACLLLHS